MDKRKAVADEIPRLRRYARALQRDPGAADDLVQDCLERALSRLHLYRDGTNMRAWLLTILHNIHVNDARRRKRTLDSVPLEPHIGNHDPAQTGQGGSLELRDLSRALDRLSDEQREVVLLVGLEGLSYKEVAAIIDAPVGTVMSRLARGRERLRRLTGYENVAVVRSGK